MLLITIVRRKIAACGGFAWNDDALDIELDGYQELSSAFYNYLEGKSAPATTDIPTIIATIGDANSATALEGYFPELSTAAKTITPLAFIAVKNFAVAQVDATATPAVAGGGFADDVDAEAPVIVVTDNADLIGGATDATAAMKSTWDAINEDNATFGTFILYAKGVTTPALTDAAAFNGNVKMVEVSTDGNCGDNTTNCITVTPGIGSIIDENGVGADVPPANDVYLLASSFAMLDVMFPWLATPETMYKLATDTTSTCLSAEKAFSLSCLVSEVQGESVISIPKDQASAAVNAFNLTCLTQRVGCGGFIDVGISLPDLDGYQEVSSAFYNYLKDETAPTNLNDRPTTIATIGDPDSAVALRAFFPEVTPEGEGETAIAPLDFIAVESFAVVSADADVNPAVTGGGFAADVIATAPVIVVMNDDSLTGGATGEAATAAMKSTWDEINDDNSEFGTFILYAEGVTAPALTADETPDALQAEFNSKVKMVEVRTDGDCSGNAINCITVTPGIGSVIQDSGEKGAASTANDVYLLASSFAMLKVMFPSLATPETMYKLATDTDSACLSEAKAFSLSCLVSDNGTAISFQKDADTGTPMSGRGLFDTWMASKHAKSGVSFVPTYSSEGVIASEGSFSLMRSDAIGSATGSQLRILYNANVASFGVLVGTYSYADSQSALYRNETDASMMFGAVADVHLTSDVVLYGQAMTIFETGSVSTQYGETRMDRFAPIGVLGVAYNVSSDASLSFEGRCSLETTIFFGTSSTSGSSSCSTSLRMTFAF